jgi:hypothetical protein
MVHSSRLLPVALLCAAACGGGEREPPGRTPDASGPDAAPPLDGAPSDAGREAAGGDATARDAAANAPETRAPDTAAPDTGPGDVRGDTTGSADGASVACPPGPPLDQPWITPMQTDLIARLTGEAELAPGVTLADRATARNRQLAREHIAAAWRELGITPQLHDYGTGTNLHARLESTTGNEQQVVLGAHLDTVSGSPGANDNATGVAVVHAVGRYLKQLGCRSRAVTLVLFDEEEVGLIGSKQFARKLADERAAVHSVHSVDQVGWDRDGDRMVELERPDSGLFELYDSAVRALAADIPLTITRTGGSDHASFRPTFPAVGVTEGYRSGDTSPHRHKPTDRQGTVDLGYLRSTTLLVGRVLAELVR